MNISSLRSLSFVALLLPACAGHQRTSGGHESDLGYTPFLYNPWEPSSQPANSLIRPSTASSVQIREISTSSDPLLTRGYRFLQRLAADPLYCEAYAPLIQNESLEEIQAYMTPGSPTYDSTYRWRVFINPTTQNVEGVSVTYRLTLPNGQNFTIVDFHTPSERPIDGQMISTFPACPPTDEICMVEVNSRTARGYRYYSTQGFRETILGERYVHIARPAPEHAVLLIFKRDGGEIPLEDILRVYAESFGSTEAIQRLQRNLTQLINP